jgi:hypothetical protein
MLKRAHVAELSSSACESTPGAETFLCSSPCIEPDAAVELAASVPSHHMADRS